MQKLNISHIKIFPSDEFICKECGGVNEICVGQSPIDKRFDLTQDKQSDWDYFNDECEMCGAENKIRADFKANPQESIGG